MINNRNIKGILFASLIALITGIVGTRIFDGYHTKNAISEISTASLKSSNVSSLLDFEKLILDYANDRVPKEYTLINITDIATPLYNNADTRNLAYLMEKASGIIEDNGDLKAFLSKDFSEALYRYSTDTNLDLNVLFPS